MSPLFSKTKQKLQTAKKKKKKKTIAAIKFIYQPLQTPPWNMRPALGGNRNQVHAHVLLLLRHPTTALLLMEQ